MLAERSEQLAKGWLLALVEEQPLASAPSILAAQLARDGPAICAALVRALVSEDELERIEPGGESEALVSRTGELAGAVSAEGVSAAVDALRAVLWGALLGSLADSDASLVAELAERLALVSELVRGAALRRLAGEERPSLADTLTAEVARARAAGGPLSLLLVELEDAERMLALELEPAGVERLEAVLRSAASPDHQVIGDAGGRAWVIAPGVGLEGASEVGSALAAAVGDAGSWHGAPLRASVGVATLGPDGADATSLIEAAEEASLAAAARGIEVNRAAGPEPAG